MDKNTFIKELERSLSVLQETEIKDILSEYEQHIDLKVKSGLSEEEAIADFGSLPELISEILEAYHVRADYALDRGTDEIEDHIVEESAAERRGAGNTAGEQVRKVRTVCGKAWEMAAHGTKLFCHWLLGVLIFWKRQIGRPFVWGYGIWKNRSEKRKMKSGRIGGYVEAMPIPETMIEEIPMERMAEDNLRTAKARESGQRPDGLWNDAEKGKDRRKMVGTRMAHSGETIFRKLADMIGKGVSFCIRLILWGIRMTWNAGWILFSLICGISGLFCLFGLGVFIVLLLQHYPMTGVTIGCLGLTCCLFSAAGLGLSFLWKKERKENHSTGKGTPGRGDGMTAGGTSTTVEETDVDMDRKTQTEAGEQFQRMGGEQYA